jgi:RNA polymerase sigma-54 factor
MALEQKLTVKLSQKLIMTPSLQQAIKLLQMSKLELVEEVAQELEENPVLEDGSTTETVENAPAKAEGPAEVEANPEKTPYDEIDYESFFQDLDGGYVPRPPVEYREELPSYENTLSKPSSLSDHLLWQLDLSTSSDKAKAIGRAIVGNLDEDGFLRATVDELCGMDESFATEEVEATLRFVQEFDPPGVASRDLRECLLYQLRHLGIDGGPEETIIREHLDKLQNQRYKDLAEQLSCTMEDLGHHLEIIRGLDPRPGQKYNSSSSQYVVPDVYVVKIDNEYQVLLNEEGLPRLRISPVYRRMIDRNADGTNREARAYVRDKLRSAFRLIKSLEERQRTIYKVATSIVKYQREFLEYGIEKIRPLVLRDVADDIGMHESTVSRVVNNKYMHTHRGLFEMRFFFHSGIASSFGEDISSLTVKQKIRKIVGDEDPHKPYSDSEIVKMLRSEGLQIARRTVAKYREELRIPSSTSRRQIFG